MTRALAAALVGTLLERPKRMRRGAAGPEANANAPQTRSEAKYRIDTFIGAGERGALVFRAHEIVTGTPVAVRCPGIPDALSGLAYEQALDTFLREAELLARASETSKDVERLLSFGIAEPEALARLPFCVFEWLEGKPLEQHIRECSTTGALPSIGEALAILEPAARALVAVHATGVSHKDVRPRNLWLATVDGRTRMKLTQFVLASRIGGSEDAFAPEYAAPEHFKRSYGPVGPHTDVYGLALCLVELVSGKRALEGSDATELYLATSDLARRPTLRARGVQISDAVEGVVARALAVDPKRRWQNVRELWDALIAAMPELTPLAPSVRPPQTMDDEAGTGEAEGIVHVPSTSRSGRPGASSPWASRETAAAILAPSDDARLGDAAQIASFAPPAAAAAAPKKRDRAGLIAWLIVLALGAVGIAVVAKRLVRSPSHVIQRTTTSATAPAQPMMTKSALDAASPQSPVLDASAATAKSGGGADEPAVSFSANAMPRPFLTDMIRIPPGKFMMGTDKEGKPAHAVKITKAFFIDRMEVTAEMYSACIDEGVCTSNRVHSGDAVETNWGCNNAKDHPKRPANCVDRVQAARFCAFAQKRLPTEAEWEYAARGSDGREYPWGNPAPTTCTQAIIAGLSGDCKERKGPMEVGSTPDGRSAFGVLDMAGNVWEWVADGYEIYPTSEVVDPHVPTNPASNKGVLRGGSWDYSPLSAKATYRYPFQVNTGNISTGIRCARDAVD